MSIETLSIQNLRNLLHVNVQPSSQFNVLVGENGSGKSSFLEAIYLLGTGRSYRTRQSKNLIQFSKQELLVFGVVEPDISIGIEKKKNGTTIIKCQHKKDVSVAELAQLLPIQLINPHSFLLVDSGPKERRQFLDWGLFHVEPHFFSAWLHLKKVLQQRNSALKRARYIKEINIWNDNLVKYATMIDEMRLQYLNKFQAIFEDVLSQLMPDFSVDIAYERGWPKEKDLLAVLMEHLERERYLTYTLYGPHRADLQFKLTSGFAKDILSRGQQKLLVIALKLAQGLLLYKLTQKKCVYLIDDLIAELDSLHIKQIAKVLTQINAQVFVTCVDDGRLPSLQTARRFQVCHGKILLKGS